MTCETVGKLLLDYAEGELPPPQAQSIRAHLDTCPACAAKYRATRALIGDLSAARSAEQHARDSDVSSARPIEPVALEAHATVGDFEILGELGRGGMGVVYRARQISLNRVVALKMLSGGLVQSERSVSRFTREAQAAARLHHTNIVPIYAQGRERGHFYYAMELIEGKSLDEVLRQEREGREPTPADVARAEAGEPAPSGTPRKGRLRSMVSTVRLSGLSRSDRRPRDYKRIARLFVGVAEGLHHAHEQGVVHRDVKPQNLLLGPDDELHITDFGLARILDEPALTHSTELVGTPAYMSPEQITGGRKAIDRRTDVYALGVTLYEALTLERPFVAETYNQTINQILRREPKPPRKLNPHAPPDLETICLRAMEKEPSRRFPTAAAMASDLRRYAQDYPIASRRVGPLGRALRWARRNPARASALAAAVLVAVLLPLLAVAGRSVANGQAERALTILRDDYREEWGRALDELGWISRLFGNRYRREFAIAFAHIREAPAQSIELMERTVAERAHDPDAHYLLAWAYTRRTRTHGVETWADAQRHVALGDQLEDRRIKPTALGYFFRGQAVWGFDPEQAVRSFQRAIEAANQEGFIFTQAMLHQGRAINQIMYSWRGRDPLRAISYYQQAVSPLESVVRLQPNKAYPRYLLAITHYLAAEVYQADGRLEDAAAAYDQSWAAAEDAQVVEPSSPRGYAAKADYFESRREWAKAIAAWNHFEKDAVQKSRTDWAERFDYQMRLHFWLGEYAAAERMRAQRYGELCGYDGAQIEDYDADESFYEALLAACGGDWPAAEQALANGVQRGGQRPECLLRLDAAYRLLGRTPPRDLLRGEIPDACKLSPGWSPDWLATLRGYQRGELDWSAVEAAASRDVGCRDDLRLRMAGAHFLRGVRALAAGRRQQAKQALQAACDQYDNENYCFRAKLLLVKLERDAAWPTWLAAGDSAEP